MLEKCWSNFSAIMIGGIKKEKAKFTFHIVMQILNNTDIEMVKCQTRQTSNLKFNVMYIFGFKILKIPKVYLDLTKRAISVAL